MKTHAVSALILSITLAACGDKANIIFGPDPVRQIGESSENFSDMSEADRKILFAFVAVQMQRSPQFVIGRRARDVLVDARRWSESGAGANEGRAPGRVTAAKADLTSLYQAVKLYKLDNGRVPTQGQGLNALVSKPITEPIPKDWHVGGYLVKLPFDPWGGPYHYLVDEANGIVEIFSLGSDGTAGGTGEAADISSRE